MCLVSKHYFPNIALKDIKCYKVVKVHHTNAMDLYYTPFQCLHIPSWVIKGEEPFRPDTKKINRVPIFGGPSIETVINGGLIHSYSHLKVAINALYQLNMRYQDKYKYEEYKLFVCIIPKFTRYYKGKENDYASKQIKFINEF